MSGTRQETLLLSPEEARKLVGGGLGRNQFYELLKTKAIAHIRLGHKILIPRQSLTDWINANIIKAGA